MTTSSLNPDLNRFDRSALEIDLVATTKFPPEYFVCSHQLKFASGHDDLDSLIFTHLDLPSGNTISLVRHQNAPYQGTEIHLPPGLSDPSKVLVEALHLLNLSGDDLDWIHPQTNLTNLV